MKMVHANKSLLACSLLNITIFLLMFMDQRIIEQLVISPMSEISPKIAKKTLVTLKYIRNCYALFDVHTLYV